MTVFGDAGSGTQAARPLYFAFINSLPRTSCSAVGSNPAPRPLISLWIVLLEWRVSFCNDRGDRTAFGFYCLPCRTKIDQDRAIIFAQDHIGRLYVSMKKALLVNRLQPINYRQKDFSRLDFG